MKSLKWFIGCLVFLTLAIPAAANGAPIKIFLNYLPEVSNYGPNTATGEALVSIGEAWVDLKAEGLPQLSGQLYEAWLVEAEADQMVSLGKFNADADGHVVYYVELDQIPDVDYRYFIISVEPDPDSNPKADSRRTIAGVFPNPQLLVVSETPTPTFEPGVTPTPGTPAPPNAPVTLPVTGNVILDSGFWILDFAILALGLSICVIGFILLKNERLLCAKCELPDQSKNVNQKSKIGDKL